MTSPAFVSAIPLSLTTSRPSLTTSRTLAQTPVTRRSLNTTTMQLPNEENKKIPQGFTGFSERLNGRAAMIGFVAAVGCELLRPELRIVDQISPLLGPLNLGAIAHAATSGLQFLNGGM